MRWCTNMDKYEVWLQRRREDIQKFKDKSMQFYFHTKQKSELAFHLCWKVTMALLRIIATLSLILFLISWQHHWTWELLSSSQQEEQAPRTSGAQHLWKRCKVNDVMKENIAKGTTDLRVEFISQVQIQILIIFHFQNLDRASTSKSKLIISLSIKLQNLD